MIATQQIKSTTDKPVPFANFEVINVLKWNNSKWKTLCPYYLKTDGNEWCANPGGILFENFYQGCKVYDVVYENEVYPSKYHTNNPQHLWWKFTPMTEGGDRLINNNNDSTTSLNRELYLNWRNSLWNCPNPIRYPNKIHRRKNTQFALCIDKDGAETRLDYIACRKEIYAKEYMRLIRVTKEYKLLLEKLKKGINLMICEVDVPANGKKGAYGLDCNENNICQHMTLDKLQTLMNDPSEAFGHGLCLAYALLNAHPHASVPFPYHYPHNGGLKASAVKTQISDL